MALPVTVGAQLACSFGAAPSALIVVPQGPPVLAGGKPCATIMDHQPLINIPPFGMCSAPTNPQVAAATAAALGVLTPMPCIPATTAPWIPPSPTVLYGGKPLLPNTAKLLCNWLGVIQITNPGTMGKELIPP